MYSISVNVVSPTGCFFFFFLFPTFLSFVSCLSKQSTTYIHSNCVCVCMYVRVQSTHRTNVYVCLYVLVKNRHTLPHIEHECVRFLGVYAYVLGSACIDLPYMVKNLDRHSRFALSESTD